MDYLTSVFQKVFAALEKYFTAVFEAIKSFGNSFTQPKGDE